MTTEAYAKYKNMTIEELETKARAINKEWKEAELQGTPIKTSMYVDKAKYDKKTGAKAELGYSVYSVKGTMYANFKGTRMEIRHDKDGNLILKSTTDKTKLSELSVKATNGLEKVTKDYIKALGLDITKYKTVCNNYKTFLAEGIEAFITGELSVELEDAKKLMAAAD